MTNKLLQTIENNFVETCLAVIDEGEFGLILPLDDRWSTPINIKGLTLHIIISNWAYEQFKYDEVGVTIKTAFGEVESSATFTWSEVLGITEIDLKPIMTKCDTTIKSYTMKGMMK